MEAPWSAWTEDEREQLDALNDLSRIAAEKAKTMRGGAQQLQAKAEQMAAEAADMRQQADVSLTAANAHRKGFMRRAAAARGIDPKLISQVAKKDDGSLVAILADQPVAPVPGMATPEPVASGPAATPPAKETP